MGCTGDSTASGREIPLDFAGRFFARIASKTVYQMVLVPRLSWSSQLCCHGTDESSSSAMPSENNYYPRGQRAQHHQQSQRRTVSDVDFERLGEETLILSRRVSVHPAVCTVCFCILPCFVLHKRLRRRVFQASSATWWNLASCRKEAKPNLLYVDACRTVDNTNQTTQIKQHNPHTPRCSCVAQHKVETGRVSA